MARDWPAWQDQESDTSYDSLADFLVDDRDRIEGKYPHTHATIFFFSLRHFFIFPARTDLIQEREWRSHLACRWAMAHFAGDQRPEAAEHLERMLHTSATRIKRKEWERRRRIISDSDDESEPTMSQGEEEGEESEEGEGEEAEEESGGDETLSDTESTDGEIEILDYIVKVCKVAQ